ncbi:P-loop containing nucleoside triphosphate hydrolase protein [Apodospora peruviana]|uniref:P-loop containing nucleoside triphosphate hydrolase protein n=1 Tax=Apodospora peruviana TaxID=516989 RepID=A0AAE0IT96_9PEZI|nr:P-loop containing nucleoside triphosphate hydrolase protein [Apodospora peruviana]
MATKGRAKYIPVGCLRVETGSSLSYESWPSSDLRKWHYFGHGHANEDTEALSMLPEPLQRILFISRPLSQFADLLRKRWIQLSFKLSMTPDNTAPAIIRVFILPDDIDNTLVPRDDPSLRKARRTLMDQLDFARSTWHGEAGTNPSPSLSVPDSVDDEADGSNDQDRSLLQVFNNIPSPDPRPDDVQDPDCREAVYSLIESHVPGLNTTLYPHQRRSAAMMLQREVQTQKVMDPRFQEELDQRGSAWYYDAVTGTALREPRLYDGPCGGILAEEMGSGKTLICLALVLATRHIPSAIPDIYWSVDPLRRSKVGSLADMAAACITKNSVPWKLSFENAESDGFYLTGCLDAIRRNKSWYSVTPPQRRRETRRPQGDPSPPQSRIYLSHASLIVVPPNLIQQWKQEIEKHTAGLKYLIITQKQTIPPVQELLEYDVILFSATRFERLIQDCVRNGRAYVLKCPLAEMHFKRCIVDEGHKLGNSTYSNKSNLHLVIEYLHVTARWVVTGTPSKGLYGVDGSPTLGTNHTKSRVTARLAESSGELEKDDLRRIGSIATLYLRLRPWANTSSEMGDTPADWATYVMPPEPPKHLSMGRRSCLRATLESLIIRHRLSDIRRLLPVVDEKLVYLEPSYQDTLVLNLFSAMIIFNAVLSERKDQDYLFHPRQRKALTELVSNLRQASFFGGSFFSPDEITKAVDTAEKFLDDGKVPTSAEDTTLLRGAIEFGRLSASNTLKLCANLFREIPVYLRNFPWAAGQSWSLDLKEGDPVCTDARMIHALQKLLQPVVDAPTSLQLMFESGRFAAEGTEARAKGMTDAQELTAGSSGERGKTLAGNTRLGEDNSDSRRRSVIFGNASRVAENATPAVIEGNSNPVGIAKPLARTQVISTASAKLSYLVDQIVKYHHDEQIIVFYENDNVAYYLAQMLEILQIQHLIYAKGLTTERRAQYVATFNQNPKFRVLLMDITQAAFGLDMKSASRIYFINPVLNPQVETQAIGRARRLSQLKPVTVETLVLRGSLEEVIVQRHGEMTQAEQRKCHSILDDKPIYEWILNAKILPLPDTHHPSAGHDQMAKLQTPQLIFGRGFGREVGDDPDRDLVATVTGTAANISTSNNNSSNAARTIGEMENLKTCADMPQSAEAAPSKKRPFAVAPELDTPPAELTTESSTPLSADDPLVPPQKAKKPRVRFAD